MRKVVNFDPAFAERHMRSPKHTYAVEQHFWEIQPVCIAPVLPGETLKRVAIQERCVTSPLKSRVVGWWRELFLFYVPFRQMPDSANLVAMFIDPTATLTPTAAASYRYYAGLGYDFVSQCLQVVTQEWFRREGVSWSSSVIRANRPAAQVNMESIADSLIDSTVLPDGGAPAGNADDQDRLRIVTEYRRMLKEMGSDGASVDYEEVLSSYGARIRDVARRDRPELIRYIRDWTYPVNTVEPTTGVPTTAASWAITDLATKPRTFNEPGFIFGVTVVRPKCYYANQTGTGASMLDRAQRWLPPMMEEAGMERSLAEFTTLQGPFGKAAGGFTNGYWLDIRDLFNHGDQYVDVNGAAITTYPAANVVALPTTGEETNFATLAIADALQVTAGALTIADGSIQLGIMTRHVDAS